MLRHLLPLTPYPYRGERVDCPVCGSADHAPVARLDRRLKRLPTALCDHCGLFFTNPMPTEAELAAYYRGVYRLDYQFALGRPTRAHKRRKTAESRRRWEAIAAHADLSVPRRVLDAGCGSGELVARAAAEGHEAHGFEPSPAFADHAGRTSGGQIRCGSWQDMDYPPRHFDVIACLHVLEHLRRPVAALSRIGSWLKPGGILYLEVPDMQDALVKGFERFHFAHVLGFSEANLVLAASRAGLGVAARPAPTSLMLSPAAPVPEVDLAGAAARNRAEYGAGIGFRAYVAYHADRLRQRARRIRRERRQG